MELIEAIKDKFHFFWDITCSEGYKVKRVRVPSEYVDEGGIRIRCPFNHFRADYMIKCPYLLREFVSSTSTTFDTIAEAPGMCYKKPRDKGPGDYEWCPHMPEYLP